MRSDFPGRRDSPDPEEMIRALLKHGTYRDTASEVGCASNTVGEWLDKYPEIEEAYKRGRANIGLEAEQTLVREMRGKAPPDVEDAPVPKASDRIRAAKKVLGTNHPYKDYTQSQKVIRETDSSDSEVQEKVDSMSMNDLLEELSKRQNE